MQKISLLITCLVALSGQAYSQALQNQIFLLPDTAQAFTINQFYELVTQNHPVAKQVELLSDFARQEIRLARGNFDPQLEGSFSQKKFNGQEYYSISQGSLKFPTLIPVDPSVGIEKNRGQYLNPEKYISSDFDNTQLYVGVSVPIGRGLITDDRRTALRQAELFGQMTEAEQVRIINILLFHAARDYWQWYFSYYYYRLTTRGVEVANDIYRRVKMNYEMGEAAMIDTVQAKITLLQRQVERQEAYLDFQNTGIMLSNYLWDSLGNPVFLLNSSAPVLRPDNTPVLFNDLMQLAKENHPDLRKIRVQLQQLETDRKLAAEYLKPVVNLNYYRLSQTIDSKQSLTSDFDDNFKFGVDLAFPLFIRKERAKLAQAKIKITSTQYEQDLTEREILNEVTAVYNELINTQRILRQQEEMVNNYERLLQAELVNLENGESDLFRINIQQERLLDSQAKLVKLLSELEKQKAMLYWAAGVTRL